MVSMGLLAPNTDNLCKCSSSLLWYIVFNVFSLKNRVHIASSFNTLFKCMVLHTGLTGLIVLDAFPSFDSLFGILLEWLFHYIPAVVL